MDAQDEIRFKFQPLRPLDRFLRSGVEKKWGYLLLTKLGIFVVGFIVIITPAFSYVYIFYIILLTVMAEILSWDYQSNRSAWERLHRELDERDSFGEDWAPSRMEASDLINKLPKKISAQIVQAGEEENYFSSLLPFGAKRALENLRESSRRAKILSKEAGNLSRMILLIVFLAIFLWVIAYLAQHNPSLDNINQVLGAVVMLLYSLDLLHTMLDYFKFSSEASEIENKAFLMLGQENINEVQVIKLWKEYHLARAESPIISRLTRGQIL